MQLYTAGECQHSASEMERTLRTRPSDAAIIARQRRPNPTRSMRPEGGTAKNDKPDQITEDSWEVTRPPRAQPGSDAGPSRIKQSSSSSPWREFYTEPQAAPSIPLTNEATTIHSTPLAPEAHYASPTSAPAAQPSRPPHLQFTLT